MLCVNSHIKLMMLELTPITCHPDIDSMIKFMMDNQMIHIHFVINNYYISESSNKTISIFDKMSKSYYITNRISINNVIIHGANNTTILIYTIVITTNKIMKVQ